MAELWGSGVWPLPAPLALLEWTLFSQGCPWNLALIPSSLGSEALCLLLLPLVYFTQASSTLPTSAFAQSPLWSTLQPVSLHLGQALSTSYIRAGLLRWPRFPREALPQLLPRDL